jgi:YVTN family beta-propeller protein
MKLRRLIGLATAALILVGCGGGGNGNHQEGMSNTAKQLLTPYGQIVNPVGSLLKYGISDKEQLAMDCALSPDGKILAVKGKHWLVLVDTKSRKVIKEALLPNDIRGTYKGIVWSRDGKHIYLTTSEDGESAGTVSTGKLLDAQINSDGNVTFKNLYAFSPSKNNNEPPIPNDIVLSKDGRYLYIALNGVNKVVKFDIQNKSIVWQKKVGKFPYGIALANGKLYVTNWGGRIPGKNDNTAPVPEGQSSGAVITEKVVADPKTGAAASGTVTVLDTDGNILDQEIDVGLHPNAIIASPDGSRIYVANGNDDTVSVIDTATNRVTKTIDVMIDPSELPTGTIGASPNAVALSPDGKYLYVADGTINAVAVVKLNNNEGESKVIGFIPTGAYPGGLSISKDGKILYVADTEGLLSTVPNQANGSSNPGFDVYDSNPVYNTHHELGYISIIDLPYNHGMINNDILSDWTKKTEDNIRLVNILQNLETLKPPRKGVPPKPVPDRIGEPSVFKHVIYIIKENRAYDQVLGDMKEGNGDPNLVVFGRDVTPNEHKIAREFLLLDNFYNPAKCSAEGHIWATSAYLDDYVEKNIQGWFRGYYTFDAMATPKSGYIWDNVLDHNKTFMNFGESLAAIGTPIGNTTILQNIGFIKRTQDYQDPNYPGWNLDIQDQKRADEFIKKLKEWEKNGSMPNFIIMALQDDHTNGLKPGKPTPRAMVADNDLALGRIVEAVSHSKFWKNTVIFVTEDDSQDGWDHVSAYRTTGFVISPYSRLGKLVHTRYNLLSMIHTIEQILGIPPMNLLDLSAPLMKDCFTNIPDFAPYNHVPNKIDLNETNPSLSALKGKALYWAKVASKMPEGIDIPENDDKLKRMIWYSVKGYNTPYPEKYTVDEDTDEQ